MIIIQLIGQSEKVQDAKISRKIKGQSHDDQRNADKEESTVQQKKKQFSKQEWLAENKTLYKTNLGQREDDVTNITKQEEKKPEDYSLWKKWNQISNFKD